MREIKFRFWNKDELRMEMAMHLDPRLFKVESDPLAMELIAESYEVMQFTGMRDGNGQSVYEQDILENEFDGSRAICVWFEPISYNQPAMSGFTLISADGTPGFASFENSWLAKSKVIGNRFENPGLLKGKNVI